MIELFQAINDRISGVDGAAYRVLLDTNAFYYGRAPQSESIQNYCVYTGLQTIDEKVFRVAIDQAPIQFNNYSKSASSAAGCFALHKECKELFENQKIEIDNYYDVVFNKILEVPPVNLDGIKWMSVIEFNVLLQRKAEIRYTDTPDITHADTPDIVYEDAG